MISSSEAIHRCIATMGVNRTMAGGPSSRRHSGHMKTEKQLFRITADGVVYGGTFESYDNLGHIGSILHPMNRSHVASQVRAWWNATLASNEPIEEYVPRAATRPNPVIIRVRPAALVVSSAFTDDAAGALVEVVGQQGPAVNV